MTGPVLAEIGPIRVTSSTVRTPAGEFPLRGSQWTATDQWVTEQRTPRWAIVVAILCFWATAFLSLLLLRIRRPVVRGVVQVDVTNGWQRYEARIPVADQAEVHALHQRIAYVRSLAAL